MTKRKKRIRLVGDRRARRAGALQNPTSLTARKPTAMTTTNSKNERSAQGRAMAVASMRRELARKGIEDVTSAEDSGKPAPMVDARERAKATMHKELERSGIVPRSSK